MSSQKKSSRLEGKDLITIGIYTDGNTSQQTRLYVQRIHN